MYQKKKNSWIKHLDFVILDNLLMLSAYVFSFYLRHNDFHLFDIPIYRSVMVVIVVFGLFLAIAAEPYKNILRRGALKELGAVIEYVTLVTVSVILFLFAIHDDVFSRAVMLWTAAISVGLLWTFRMIWSMILLRIGRRDTYGKRHMLLITTKELGEKIIKQLKERAFGDYEIMGLVLVDAEELVGSELFGIPVVSSIKKILPYMQTRWVDEVMIYLPQERPLTKRLMDEMIMMGITLHINVDMAGNIPCMKTVEKVGGVTVLTESIRIVSSSEYYMKRIIDIIGALVGIFFTCILTVFLGIAIFISDPGPIFFSQKRVGQNGRIFKIYKFRSMYKDAEERLAGLMDKNEMSGLMFKMDNDPRIIGSGPDGKRHGIGWFIRKTSLDEFPQFFNVLLGQMSLVGTRPPTVAEWEQYELHHRARMSIRPGLTGLWQVSGRSDITNFEEVVALDMEYINNWSLAEDIKILLKTVKIVFTGDGAK